MKRMACCLAILLGTAMGALCWQEPEGLFERFHAHMKSEQRRLPEYVCTQTVERFQRSGPEEAWRKSDTLRFDVALVGDQELYGKAGSGQFFDQSLADVVRSGVVSTGRFGLLARQVLDITTTKYRYKGLNERAGRPAHEYGFDVPAAQSNYSLRSGKLELPVSFQGQFWVDTGTLDLRRLELQAYDIPEKLGLAEAGTSLVYERTNMDGEPLLLPVSGEVMVVTAAGLENLNRTKVGGCRRYQTESKVRFAGDSEVEAGPAGVPKPILLPVGVMLEITLEEGLDLEKTVAGQTFKARLTRDIKDGERVIIPQGSVVEGEIVHWERETTPFLLYEIGLELHSLDLAGRSIPFAATMEEAGPASGLIRQSKRMDPEFNRRRTARMSILVRKVQRGQGYLHWDGRRGPVPRGLKMKWKVIAERE
ncbi:MAG: hypothetical protein IT167_26005 [Bryobacterales bacterium]|nr:hypothetical protein [Bryobacterales bacterium]